MSKKNRGKGIAELPGKGKGVCPICSRKSVKILWDATVNGKTMKVCKRCGNHK